MEEEDTPPFWLQTTDTRRGRRRNGGQSSSLFFSTGLIVILLLFTALAFIFFIIPSFLSYTSQVFSPHSVKKSWNSLNLVLVLFAVVCGFFGRNGDSENGGTADGRNSFKFSTGSTPRYQRSNSSTPRQWYNYSDRDSFRRMRSSNSYPDLRVESQWTAAEDDRWRFYDDTRVYDHRGQSSSSNQIYQSWREQEDERQFGSTKVIGVDSVVSEAQPRVSQTPPPPRPESPPARLVTPPSPPRPASPPSTPRTVTQPPQPESPPTPPLSPPRLPPPKAVRRKQKRTYQDLPARNRIEGNEIRNFENRDPEPQTPPPPPPPPPATYEKTSKIEKKRSGATKDFLNSLRRRKKKQRQKSVENLEALFNPEPTSSTPPLYPPPSPPPPPPPLPPPAFFQNIFSPKRSKAKKVQSSAPPPPPPPRRPLETRASKIASQKAPVATRKPPLPVNMSSIYNTVDENTDSGNESPLNPIPRPPPPPPFKMPAWKFVVQGDFVRLNSIRSSQFPDEDPPSGESSPSLSRKSESEGGDSPAAAMFCPSPDVDTKADNFIARFRAGLQLEKVDSVRQRSNLGPDLDPSPKPGSLER